MKKSKVILCFMISFLVLGTINILPVYGANEEQIVDIFPYPNQIEYLSGEDFVVDEEIQIVVDAKSTYVGKYLANLLEKSTGFDIPVVGDVKQLSNVIYFAVDESAYYGDFGILEEAYRIDSNKNIVEVRGYSERGLFNGLSTLRQMLPTFSESKERIYQEITIAPVEIVDAPRFEHRGVMLDVARSFLTVDEVKDIIDIAALYKINSLHLHLSDDQGWRIEITNDGKKEGDTIDYSLLTSVSGKTAVSGEGILNEEYGHTGFYTQDDYKELIRYAGSQNIEIVPEIDVPGHINAALAAIPELNTEGSSHNGTLEEPTAPVNETQKVGFSYLDPNEEVTYVFLEHVFSQLADMTEADSIHIGGDESHDMVEEYGKDVFIKTVEKISSIIRECGKNPVGWDEYSVSELQSGDIVQYWDNNGATIKKNVENNGAKVINSNDKKAYLDQAQSTPYWLGLTWVNGSLNYPSFVTYYDWDPTNFGGSIIKPITIKDVYGVEGALWAETIRGKENAEYMLFPRLISLAEVGWTKQEIRDTQTKSSSKKLIERMEKIGPSLTVRGANFFDGKPSGLFAASYTWDYESVGKDTQIIAENDEISIGLLSAPGTTIGDEGKKVVADSEDKTDKKPAGVSTLENQGLTYTIDWGDDSAHTQGLFRTDKPRTNVSSTGMIELYGNHHYEEAGEYKGVIEYSDGNQTPFRVVVPNDEGKVIVHYIDEEGTELVEDIELIGKIGDSYLTERKEIDGYDFVEVQGSDKGEFGEEIIEVTYVYKEKENLGKVIVHYIDEEGTELLDDIELIGKIGDSYLTEKQDIEGYEFIKTIGNTTGKFIEEDIEVTYVYKMLSNKGQVFVHYIDEDGQEIAEDVKLIGDIGSVYETEQKEIENYELVEVKGNKSGKFAKEDIEVTYVYKKIVKEKGKVIVHYIDTDGHELLKDIELEGHIGDLYTTEKKEIKGYEFVKVQGKTEGQFAKENIEVSYVYKQKVEEKGTVIVHYVDENANKLSKDIIISDIIGAPYSADKKKFDGYTFLKVEGNEKGTITKRAQEVTYIYQKEIITTNEKLEILFPMGKEYTRGETYTIKIEYDSHLLSHILMDGKRIDSKNYTVKDGSTVITFTKEYMQTLEDGKHIIAVYYNDETRVEGQFTILENAEGDVLGTTTTDAVPTKTGDTTTIMPLVIIFVISGSLLFLVSKNKKTHK